MTLTAEQLTRFREDVGDTLTPPAFSDDEINDLYTAEGWDWNKALLRALWRLLSNAARLHDYVQNETQERQQQVFANLQALYRLQLEKVEREHSQQPPRIVGLQPVPRKCKPQPRC